ncbi:MAG: hypothetical protein DI539_21415 [Flavobacterium psychrophilum]|nr:MAG: hypothetical protein DI539_21415 [Flavobacterium psychrophilum]
MKIKSESASSIIIDTSKTTPSINLPPQMFRRSDNMIPILIINSEVNDFLRGNFSEDQEQVIEDINQE